MLETFKSTWVVNTIYSVSPTQLKEQGVRAVFGDLDDTLIAWNNPDGAPKLGEWVDSLREAHIPLIVISNNNKERVREAVNSLGLPFISRSLKPLSFGIDHARKKLNLAKGEVVMVDDRLLTDVAAANQAGIRGILVRPLLNTDKWDTRINRFFEHRVWKSLNKKRPDLK